jgi:hypothetical protein
VSTQIARFEPVQQPTGWTVVDLLSEKVIRPRRSWSESIAAIVAEALDAAPAYAIHWTWVTPASYPVERWDVLASAVCAVSLDGRSLIRLLPGTTFETHSGVDECGRVEIVAFAPGDVGGDSVHRWLVDEAELRAAAAAMPGQEAVA